MRSHHGCASHIVALAQASTLKHAAAFCRRAALLSYHPPAIARTPVRPTPHHARVRSAHTQDEPAKHPPLNGS